MIVGRDADKRRVSVTLSVPRSLDEFFRELADKTIDVNGRKIRIVKTRNEIYVSALEFALMNVNLWAEDKKMEQQE